VADDDDEALLMQLMNEHSSSPTKVSISSAQGCAVAERFKLPRAHWIGPLT